MPILRIPTPLRPFADGASDIDVRSGNVAQALEEATHKHPALHKHLYTESGELRAFVNVFLNDEDIRYLKGTETPLADGDRLMIVPSIAGGGEGEPLQKVDHAALRTNQTFIIALSLTAFVLDASWLAGFVGLVMLLGTLLKMPGFGFLYKRLLKPLGWVKPDAIPDNPEPHRFAQGFGAVVMLGAQAAFLTGGDFLGWALVWLVVALAALNLFGGFCVGCAMYYWLNRLRVPGFVKAPPVGTFPGTRPKATPR